MELRHLQHFVAVAEDQHFTRAAERLMVSQSGLSSSIRALERELQAPLFVRTTRRVTLTEAGRALLGEAERILAQVRSAQDAVAAVQGVLRGTLSLGTEQCIAGVDVAKLLAAFRRRHPDVEIRLRQAGSEALAEEVAAGRLDLAFAVRTRADGDQLRSVPLTSEPMTVLCHPTHHLATAAVVTPQELGGEAFVDFHPDWGPRRTTDAAFAAADVRRTVALEVSDVHSLLELVHEGLGIAVVPRHFGHKREAGDLTALPFKGACEASYETVAMLPPPDATSPAARALMVLLDTPQEGV
ncbi:MULTISPECIES: LysR family transcriptional regulator [Streptomyces]|jgi:DNA-binding transcriptional LysR family regulator|uniref:DNA-binding transcriptional regulator, LysR family n=1 Tax=Streptomyces mirabilis TaxID=68239 RepID=A0A1I2ASR1_9ACTN|nr:MULTISPECIES: LysR substrate-binding domain-containing protein [Streptomyces]MDX3762212.1 LysR substrate-binding domain-containing protein [Streptomyces sp. AK02-04a]SFE46789.1 DNA-binding transcriptional regulator, LysR family [Streptomyces mirabilis]